MLVSGAGLTNALVAELTARGGGAMPTQRWYAGRRVVEGAIVGATACVRENDDHGA